MCSRLIRAIRSPQSAATDGFPNNNNRTGARTRISELKDFNDNRTGARTRISELKAFNDNRTGARCEQRPGQLRVHDVVTALLAFDPQADYRAPTRPGVVNPYLTRVLLIPRTRSVAVNVASGQIAPVLLQLSRLSAANPMTY